MQYRPPRLPNWREVRAQLARNQITARRLAVISGLTSRTISRFLNGRLSPSEGTAHRLRFALDQLGLFSQEEEGAHHG